MTIVPIRGLFEAHLTVSDLDRSIAFYRDVLGLPLATRIPERQVAFFWVPTPEKAMLGLPLATRIPERQVAFFWVPTPEKAMLGLWSIGTSPLRMRLHIAFKVDLPHVFASVEALRAAGLTPLDSGGGNRIEEPCVLCWMPAASVYFDDPDGHSLEFICVLDETPRPELGRVSWSDWRRQT